MKNCPFCGSDKLEPVKKIAYIGGRDGGKGAMKHLVFCHNCQSSGPLSDTPEQAIEAWDKRPGMK